MELESSNRCSWLVRVTVLLQCVGYFAHATAGETAIFEALWLGVDLSEPAALAISDVGAWTLLVAAAVGLVRQPRWLFYPVAAWFLATAAAETWMMSHRFYYTTVPAHALRIVAPAALVWLGRPDTTRDLNVRQIGRVLRVAAALTFLTHGWEALQHHPRFADYLLMTGKRFFGWSFEESTVLSMLSVIGVADVLVAALVLAGRRTVGRLWRPAVLWMIIWACITAFARMTHGGWPKFDATLIRAAHVGIPLTLLWLATRHQKSGQPPETHDAS